MIYWRSLLIAVCVSHVHLHVTSACALLFTLFSAQFLVHFLSNGGDRALRVRVITAAAVRLWCLLVCDEFRASLWRVDFVTSRPGDELTSSRCFYGHGGVGERRWGGCPSSVHCCRIRGDELITLIARERKFWGVKVSCSKLARDLLKLALQGAKGPEKAMILSKRQLSHTQGRSPFSR